MQSLALAMLLLGAQPAADAWEKISAREGLTLEVQPVAGSGYERIRITCATTATPQVFIQALWGKITDTSASPEVKRRDVLVDEAQVRRYYDVVHAPPASDRDYVMHEVWAADDAQQAITMNFGTVSDPVRPESKSLVRFSKIEGSFGATALATGGSGLTYVVFTDLGGAIPAWLVRGAMRESARKFVLEIRRRAEEAPRP